MKTGRESFPRKPVANEAGTEYPVLEKERKIPAAQNSIACRPEDASPIPQAKATGTA